MPALAHHASYPTAPRRIAAAACACLLSLAAVAAQAQTLSALYHSSSEHNAAYQAVKADYHAVVKRVEQAKAPLRPSLAMQGDANIVRQDGSNTAFERESSDLQVSLQGQLPLYNPAAGLRLRQAHKGALAQLSQLRNREQELVLTVAQSYFDVLAAHQDLAVVQTQKKAVTKQLEAAKLNCEVGTATITDSREAQASSDLIDAQMLTLQNQLTTAYSSLRLWSGTESVLVHPLLQPFSAPQLDEHSLPEWQTIAEENSYAIQAAKHNVELAKLQTAEARTGKKPTVNLYGSYGFQHESKSSSSLSGNNHVHDARIGVRMNWTLYDGNFTQNKIAETLLLEDKARSELLETQRQTRHAVRTAYNNLIAGKARISALQSALASSQSALQAIQTGYEVGIRINIDVLNGQNLVSQTQRDLAKAQYGLLQSQLQLRRAAGILKPEDLRHIDALLNTDTTLSQQ